LENTQLEQQLTILLRRGQRIHLTTTSGGLDLDRSAYGILCQLADEGPQRLGALAHTFGLDPSTITRQVQALESNALVRRSQDPTDRRASILALSDEGREVLDRTRDHRRARFRSAMSDWAPEELDEFARLLARFNASMDTLAADS
jgi:DNA-binding MarR family transcriptional regulator